MTKVIVTGGSGKVGRATVADLVAHGYEVFNIDQAPPREERCPTTLVDISDYGQMHEALAHINNRHDGVDAVVHLAAVPGPGQRTNAATFHNNPVSTYNVFAAANQLGVHNVVWASSETLLGLPFDEPPPYVPVDEEYFPRPETVYALGKLLDETMAAQYCRWNPDMKIIGLRFSNVMEPHDYARFPSFEDDVMLRKWNLWGYIDARDAAQAVRKALEYPEKGFDTFIIANADTVMSRPSADLVKEVYPGVPFKREVSGNETLLSIDKARRVLGYAPEHSWRDHVS